MSERHTLYWIGYRHGKRTAEHQPLQNHEPTLWREVRFAGNGKHRAWALGELRGYRQAAGLPEPLIGHRVLG